MVFFGYRVPRRISFAAFASYLLRPRMFCFFAFSCGVGCLARCGLLSLSIFPLYTLEAVDAPSSLTTFLVDFCDISQRIYEHITEQYDELGQLDMGEEHLTVMPNVFAQIGVLYVDGVRKLWESVIIPQLRMCMGDDIFGNNIEHTRKRIEENIVFCDIGSGVGNVCLQVLGETHCKKVVGVEVIPSRHRNAMIALEKAKSYYPEYYDGKSAIFLNEDIVNCSSRLTKEKVGVIFTHSWMFDDDLMKKLTEVIASVPTVLCVVTSRKLDDTLLLNHPLELVSKVHLIADWNDQAPFYVYAKKLTL